MSDKNFVNLMVKSQVEIEGYDDNLGWGLGLGLQQNELGISFWHWGSNDGYKSFVIGYPNSNMAMVYLTNSDNGLSIVDDLSCLFFGTDNYAFDWLHNEHEYPLNYKCD